MVATRLPAASLPSATFRWSEFYKSREIISEALVVGRFNGFLGLDMMGN